MVLIRLKLNEIKRDAFGRIEVPVLMLMKPHGAIIGALGNFYGLEAELKFNELSSIKFNYPRRSHGEKTKFYEQLVGDKLIQIDPYGIFIIDEVNEVLDERGKVKEVTCVSREHELSNRRFFLAEGTYNLWNPADRDNTVLGMLLADTNWNVGRVSASLIGKYRTFPETDTKVHDFMLGDMQEKYGCICDFDSYTQTVDVIDVDEAVPTVPVFLSKGNLLKSGDIKEDVSEIFTKLYVRGAEGVDIRNVNPTGENYIYNLDYYISNGDLPSDLAAKWRTWENTVFSKQAYYTSVVALRNAANSRKLSLQAEIEDLKYKLKTLDNTRATFLEMLKNPYGNASQEYLDKNGITTDHVDEYFNERLTDTATEYSTIQEEINALQAKLESVEAEISGHASTLAEINKELKMANYFSETEKFVLNCYLKEDSFEDNTFAVFDVSVDSAGTYNKLSSAPLVFTDITWREVECENGSGHRMAAIIGGRVSIAGDGVSIDANVIRGTLDHKDGEVVCSLYLGAGTDGNDRFPSGNLTYTARATYDDDTLLNGMSKHEDTIYSNDKSVSHTMYYYTGDTTIPGNDTKIYFTRNVTEYQRYSVEQDLYDYAQSKMKEIAWPGYEFDIESGNFIFARNFELFKNSIQLGCNIHLELDDDLCLKPMLIELHLNFDKPDDFTLVFSNFFQRPDRANSFKELLGKAASSSASLDMSKYEFGQNANTTTWVKNMLQLGFDAAMAQISAGKDQMVRIDESGICVDSENGMSKIYLNNGMIALLDKRTNTVNMAMGHFLNSVTGTDFVGVLADVIGGTLIAGQNLVIECPDPNGGVMQFKVDSSGVIINNGRMYMRSEKGAMGWDANYGFFAGTQDLLKTTDDGHIYPTCIDPETKELVLDDDGFPKDVNVWIGIDGKAYFRGKIYAESGIFKGTVQASTFLDSQGKNMMTNGKWDSEYLDVRGLNVNDKFIIDENGNVTIKGGSISWDSVTGTEDLYGQITSANSLASSANKIANQAWTKANNAASSAGAAADLVEVLANGGYAGGTFINQDSIQAPNIVGGNIYGANYYGNTFNVFPANGDSTQTGGLNIYGDVGGSDTYHMFRLYYFFGDGAFVNFESPAGATLNWRFDATNFGTASSYTYFYGNVNFKGASVSGLTSTAVFG